MEAIVGLVFIGLVIWMAIWAINSLFSALGSSHSSNYRSTISQIDDGARDTMRKTSNDYLSSVREKTRR